MNLTPKPHRGTFPPSWKQWRMLKAGEPLRSTDRVLCGYYPHSYQMGCEHVGFKVRDKKGVGAYPEGWYYRKVS